MLWEVTGHKIDASQMDAIRVAVMALVAQEADLWRNAPTPLVESYLGTLNTLASQLLDTGGRMRLHPEGQLDVPAPWATRDDLKALDSRLKVLAEAATASMGGEERQLDALRLIENKIVMMLEDLRHPAGLQEIMDALRADPSVLIKRTSPQVPIPDMPVWEREVLSAPAVPEPDDAEPQKKKRVLVPKAGNFVNTDGTITCRVCGKAKQTSDYYKDKHGATGFKSACKECETELKRKVAA